MYTYHALPVHVVDGDTFDFDVDLGFHITYRIRVRLADVDTPEKNAKTAAEREHAAAATQFVSELLGMAEGGKRVTIETQKDRIGIYGRYTASVMFEDGTDLGELLKENGLLKLASYPPDP